MKLKFLLMPFAVVVSIYLIIWHIYPAWLGDEAGNIKNVNKEIDKIESEIQEITTKKNNANKLSAFLESGDELVGLVSNYYPDYKKDYDLINNVNTIAFNEGVFLKDMDLEYGKAGKSAKGNDGDSVNLMSLKEADPLVQIQADLGDSKELNKAAIKLSGSKVNFVAINLKAVGTYLQIRNFMVSLNKIGTVNKTQMFEIKKSQGVEGQTDSSSDMLEVSVTVGFGYFDKSKEKSEDLLSSSVLTKNSFNMLDIGEKTDILRGVYYETEAGEIGTTNPFVMN